MPAIPKHCPYCGAVIYLDSMTQTNRSKWGIPKFYENEDINTIEFISENVRCILCNRRYDFIELSNYTWITSKIKPTDVMLQTFIKLFPDTDFKLTFENIIGVARPKGLVQNLFSKNLHICFELNGRRAYIDCFQTKNELKGLNIFEA